MNNFNGSNNENSRVAVLKNDVAPKTSIASQNDVIRNSKSVKEVCELLLSLGLSPLSVAPSQEKPLNKEGKPLFNGKRPSYLDRNGKPHTIKHVEHQDKPPSDRTIRDWFANPDNGIGCLGTNEIYWIDIDLKNFDDGQHGCDSYYNDLLNNHPILKSAWLERTRSGGYRIGVKITNKPSFTNFALSESGKHIGECLGYGRFTVLAPTVGYTNLNYPDNGFPEIESLESIGIFPGKKETSVKTDGSVDIQDNSTEQDNSKLSVLNLVCSDVKNLLNSGDNFGDRSYSLTKVANEIFGWVNWLSINKIEILDSPEVLVHDYGLKIGLDSSRIDRIIETIDLNVLPAIHLNRGGDSACFRKIERAKECRHKYEVQKSIEETILIDSFNDGDSDICVINSAFFEYTGQGYWKLLNDEYVKQFIFAELRKLFSLKKIKNIQIPQIIQTYATDKNTNSCLSACRVALSKFNNESDQKLRCFKNVTVDFATGKILNHSKDHYLQSQIPHDYKENSDCPKIFLDFTESSYGLDLLNLIRASMATFIDPTAPYEKLVHLMGESGSGKGTLADLFVEMSGQDFTASLDKFHELGKKESLYQSIIGKSLIAFLDLDGYQQSPTNIYKITRNEAVTGRALYAKTNTTFKANCRILVCSVNPVSIESSGLGWDGRAVVIPSKSAISKKNIDPRLKEKLRAVLPEIISWALSMSKDERDNLMANACDIERVKQAKQEQTISSSSVISFIESVLKPSQNAAPVSNDELYQWYAAFAKCRNYKPAAYQKFIVDMKRTLPNNFVPGKSGRNGRVKDCWIGISNLAVVFDSMSGYTCDITRLSEGGYDMFMSPMESEQVETTENIPTVQATVEQEENTPEKISKRIYVSNREKEIKLIHDEIERLLNNPYSLGNFLTELPDIDFKEWKEICWGNYSEEKKEKIEYAINKAKVLKNNPTKAF